MRSSRPRETPSLLPRRRLTLAFAFEGLPSLHQPVTVVVQAENPIDPKAFEEMQREMNRLLAQSARHVEFIDRKQMQTGVDVVDLTVVRSRGNCRMTVEPVYFDERGPLAFAQTAGGQVNRAPQRP